MLTALSSLPFIRPVSSKEAYPYGWCLASDEPAYLAESDKLAVLAARNDDGTWMVEMPCLFDLFSDDDLGDLYKAILMRACSSEKDAVTTLSHAFLLASYVLDSKGTDAQKAERIHAGLTGMGFGW